MKKFLSIFVCLVSILSFFGCASDEQTMTGTIVGFVSEYANANTPVAGASVVINGKGFTKTTGSDGRYEFADVEPGTYSLAVSADGYQSTTKQVTVYAGQTANCDFQLSKAGSQVVVSPLTLAFGTDIDQLTFSISNNNSASLQYSITGYPSCLSVSPASATVAAKGTQTVTVRVNRDLVDKDISTSLLVNVGSDSYAVSVTIGHNATQEKLSVSETLLDFGQQYSELQFTLRNTGTSGDIAWSIDDPGVACLSVSPSKGTLAMGKEAKVTVRLDRTKMEADIQTFLTINAAGGSASVQVLATMKGSGSEGDNGGETGGGTGDDNVVLNGLYTYFTFNGETKDQTDTGLTATTNGTSFVNSYDGSQALKMSASGFLAIPEGLIDQRNMSISFWVKDLYDGHVFHVVKSNNDNAFTLTMQDGALKFIATSYHLNHQYSNCSAFMHGSLNGWHMITLTSDFNSTTYGTVTTKLYVDGVFVDVVTEDNNPFSESEGMSDQKNYNTGIKFVMGSSIKQANPTTITIDNLRVYKYRAITAEEVKQIYEFEK